MITCITNFAPDPLIPALIAIWTLSLAVMLGVWFSHEFEGKRYFLLSFIAILWWTFSTGMEVSTLGLHCKKMWSVLSWVSKAILPITWWIYIGNFVEGRSLYSRKTAQILSIFVPIAIIVIAFTDPWHNLIIGSDTKLSAEGNRLDISPGALVFVAAGLLYPFVAHAIWLLFRAVSSATGGARYLLLILTVITLGPLTANGLYIFFDLTIFGIDPTPLMFSLGIISFSIMLFTDRMFDTKALGRDALFDSADDPVLVLDNHRRLLAWNAAAETHLFCFGDAQSATTPTLPDEVNIFLSELGKPGTTSQGSQLEIAGRMYEPRTLHVSSPLDPARRYIGWSLTFFDVTERVKFEESLQAALHDAEQAVRAKDDFLAVISHELRTPMTSLKGGLDLALSGRLGIVPESLSRPLSVAQKNASRLSRLIEDVLCVQNLEAGRLKISSEKVDLLAIVNSAIEENSHWAAQKHVSIVRRDDVSTPLIIVADPLKFKQVINNTLANAIKFSPSYGGDVEIRIGVDGAWARVSIRDQGEGIPPDHDKIVFGRFTQLDGSHTRASEGAGLGMYIARQMLDRMNGSICYENANSGGAIFQIYIPRCIQNNKCSQDCEQVCNFEP